MLMMFLALLTNERGDSSNKSFSHPREVLSLGRVLCHILLSTGFGLMRLALGSVALAQVQTVPPRCPRWRHISIHCDASHTLVPQLYKLGGLGSLFLSEVY